MKGARVSSKAIGSRLARQLMAWTMSILGDPTLWYSARGSNEPDLISLAHAFAGGLDATVVHAADGGPIICVSSGRYYSLAAVGIKECLQEQLSHFKSRRTEFFAVVVPTVDDSSQSKDEFPVTTYALFALLGVLDEDLPRSAAAKLVYQDLSDLEVVFIGKGHEELNAFCRSFEAGNAGLEGAI